MQLLSLALVFASFSIAYAALRTSKPTQPDPSQKGKSPPPIPDVAKLGENASDPTRVGLLSGGWMYGVHDFPGGARDLIYLYVEPSGAVTSYTSSTRLTGQIVSPGSFVVQRQEKFFQTGAPAISQIDENDVAATSSWERAQLTADDADIVYTARSPLGEHTYPLSAWCALMLLPSQSYT